MAKLITFAVPCYNSAAYMDHCVETLLAGGSDVEIILVDDGSTKDETPAICDRYAAQYPDIIRVIHQENGGHGEGVNQGLRHASGLYYKVVDSDDWLDTGALKRVMDKLREFALSPAPVDMLIANYVYEHVEDHTQKVMRYTNVFPENEVFTWADIGRFRPSQYLLMHSVIYLTAHRCFMTVVLNFRSIPFMWTIFLCTSLCRQSRVCIIWMRICIATSLAAPIRVSTSG